MLNVGEYKIRQAGIYKKLFTEIYAANESRWVAFM